jgi:hypothetical protein
MARFARPEFASSPAPALLCYAMTNLTLPCDGCGQPADPAHIARRLERLAWSTHYRPLHIQALLLAGIAPRRDEEFLYAPNSQFEGEAGEILKAIPLDTADKSTEGVLAEFQKMGLMLAHILECPLEDGANAPALLEKQLAATLARIRRSLKPKKIILLSGEIFPLAERFRALELPIFVGTKSLNEALGR